MALIVTLNIFHQRRKCKVKNKKIQECPARKCVLHILAVFKLFSGEISFFVCGEDNSRYRDWYFSISISICRSKSRKQPHR